MGEERIGWAATVKRGREYHWLEDRGDTVWADRDELEARLKIMRASRFKVEVFEVFVRPERVDEGGEKP